MFLQPQFGLVFWTLCLFVLFYFILGKFAWKPIMGALKAREEGIEKSLQQAALAREEMAKLTSDNEKLLAQARVERDEILKDARLIGEKLVTEAREKGQEENRRMVEKARQEILSEKMAALTEVKNQAANLSILVAEKVLRKQMANNAEQVAFAETIVKELHLN
jgi:F-type H+-transporting ATPase subunit b